MTIRYEVTTTPYADGRIIQELDFIHDSIRDNIMRQVLDTQDAQVRAALIQLGWTPPACPR